MDKVNNRVYRLDAIGTNINGDDIVRVLVDGFPLDRVTLQGVSRVGVKYWELMVNGKSESMDVTAKGFVEYSSIHAAIGRLVRDVLPAEILDKMASLQVGEELGIKDLLIVNTW